MTPHRKLLTATLVAVALCAGTFAAAPAQAIDNTCHPYCWTLTYPQDCQATCKLPDGSRITCGQYLGHPQCGWTSAGLATVEGTNLSTLAGEAACTSPAPAAKPAPETARAAAR